MFVSVNVNEGTIYLKFTIQSSEAVDKYCKFSVYNFEAAQSFVHVTFQANTVNSGSMSGSNYAQVSYYHNGNEQTIGVWDGRASIDMPVDVDPNSPYSLYIDIDRFRCIGTVLCSKRKWGGTITAQKR